MPTTGTAGASGLDGLRHAAPRAFIDWLLERSRAEHTLSSVDGYRRARAQLTVFAEWRGQRLRKRQHVTRVGWSRYRRARNCFPKPLGLQHQAGLLIDQIGPLRL